MQGVDRYSDWTRTWILTWVALHIQYRYSAGILVLVLKSPCHEVFPGEVTDWSESKPENGFPGMDVSWASLTR